MSQVQSFSRPSQQDISLELAIATILNASREEMAGVLKQIPPEKKQRIALAWILTSNVEEMAEVFKQLPTEKTAEIALAIAQVWQGKSD